MRVGATMKRIQLFTWQSDAHTIGYLTASRASGSYAPYQLQRKALRYAAAGWVADRVSRPNNFWRRVPGV